MTDKGMMYPRVRGGVQKYHAQDAHTPVRGGARVEVVQNGAHHPAFEPIATTAAK